MTDDNRDDQPGFDSEKWDHIWSACHAKLGEIKLNVQLTESDKALADSLLKQKREDDAKLAIETTLNNKQKALEAVVELELQIMLAQNKSPEIENYRPGPEVLKRLQELEVEQKLPESTGDHGAILREFYECILEQEKHDEKSRSASTKLFEQFSPEVLARLSQLEKEHSIKRDVYPIKSAPEPTDLSFTALQGKIREFESRYPKDCDRTKRQRTIIAHRFKKWLKPDLADLSPEVESFYEAIQLSLLARKQRLDDAMALEKELKRRLKKRRGKSELLKVALKSTRDDINVLRQELTAFEGMVGLIWTYKQRQRAYQTGRVASEAAHKIRQKTTSRLAFGVIEKLEADVLEKERKAIQSAEDVRAIRMAEEQFAIVTAEERAANLNVARNAIAEELIQRAPSKARRAKEMIHKLESKLARLKNVTGEIHDF